MVAAEGMYTGQFMDCRVKLSEKASKYVTYREGKPKQVTKVFLYHLRTSG